MNCKNCSHKHTVSEALGHGTVSNFCLEPRSYNFWLQGGFIAMVIDPQTKLLTNTLGGMRDVAPEDSCPLYSARLEGFDLDKLSVSRMQVQVRILQALIDERREKQPWPKEFEELPLWAKQALEQVESQLPKRGEKSAERCETDETEGAP